MSGQSLLWISTIKSPRPLVTASQSKSSSPHTILGAEPKARNCIPAQTFTPARMTYKYEPTEPSTRRILNFDLYSRRLLIVTSTISAKTSPKFGTHPPPGISLRLTTWDSISASAKVLEPCTKKLVLRMH